MKYWENMFNIQMPSLALTSWLQSYEQANFQEKILIISLAECLQFKSASDMIRFDPLR